MAKTKGPPPFPKSDSASPFFKAESVDIAAQHPMVQAAFNYHKTGSFSRQGGKFIFWANDLQPDPDDPTKNIHYGNKTAREYQERHPEFILMSNAETVNDPDKFLRQLSKTTTEDPLSPTSSRPESGRKSGFSPTVDDPSIPTSPGRDDELGFTPISEAKTGHASPRLERQRSSENVLSLASLDGMLSQDVREAIEAVASNSFAKSAKDRAVISAYGASTKSFFRTVELDVIMSNENVREFTIINRFDPEGKTLPKKEAYHQLRDSWLESSEERLEASKKKLDIAITAGDKNNIANATKDYQSKLSEMAEEIVIAMRNIEKDYPFSRGNNSVETAETKYTADDKARETARIAKGAEAITKYPDLGLMVETMKKKPETISSGLAVIARLEKDDRESNASIPLTRQRSEARLLESLGLETTKKPKARLQNAAKKVMKLASVVGAVVTTSKATSPKAIKASLLTSTIEKPSSPSRTPPTTPKPRGNGIE